MELIYDEIFGVLCLCFFLNYNYKIENIERGGFMGNRVYLATLFILMGILPTSNLKLLSKTKKAA